MIATFGVLGVLGRYGIDKLIGNDGGFPWSTFGINIAGSFLAGVIYFFSERQVISSNLHIALLVGFCGGFTTFSAYSLQTFLMFEKEKMFLALTYLFVSPILGLIAASLPILIMRKWIA